jgi:hypothetical protein
MRFIPKVLLAMMTTSMLVGILATAAKAGAGQDCGKAEKRELQGNEPKDWDSLYRLFKQFGDCDDGAIGEGFSEDVAQLFTKQWAHLDVLRSLAASDRAFEQFVLRHIDGTLSDDELRVIGSNSKLHCPSGQKRFCRLVQARVEGALDDQHHYSR